MPVPHEVVYNSKRWFRLLRDQFLCGFAFCSQMSSCAITNTCSDCCGVSSGLGSLSQIQGNMRCPCQMNSCTITNTCSDCCGVRDLQSDEFVYHNKHQFRLLRGQFRFEFAFSYPREHEVTVSDEFVYHNKHRFRLLREKFPQTL